MRSTRKWLYPGGLLALIILMLALGGCADMDYDGDGWTTRQEWQAGTDPQLPDSDGDGIIDSEDAAPLGNAYVSANQSAVTPNATLPTTTAAPTTTSPTTTSPTTTTPTTTSPTTTAPTTTTPTTAASTTTTPTTSAPTTTAPTTTLPVGYLELNQPYTSRLGMTVTVTNISVEETATAYRFSVSYTLQNQTAGSLPEGGFALHFDSGAAKLQSGFFQTRAAGQSVSKSFTFEELKSTQRRAVDIHYWDNDAEVDRRADSLSWQIPAY